MSDRTRTAPFAEPTAAPAPPTDLPFDNDENMDSPWHRAQIELLIDSLETRWRGRTDFYCGGNMFVHFNVERARNRDFRGPDFFVALDVERNKPRKYWAPWDNEGRLPNLILELLSPQTEKEDRTTKKDVYERTLRTPEFLLFDPATNVLEGYRLSRGKYRAIKPGADGRVWSNELKAWFGTWTGPFLGDEAVWLRLFEEDGRLVPTGQEEAAARANAAEAEVARLRAELDAMRKRTGDSTTSEQS